MSYRETAMLFAVTAFLGSFVYKFIVKDMDLTYIARDIIMFFGIYFVAKLMFYLVDMIILNYRKIM